MFVTSLKTKNAPYNDDAFRVKCVLLLCVADIDFIRAASGLLIPNPHIGDVAVLGISVEIATNIPFGVFAFYTCGNGIVPAVHGFAVQRKTDTLGIALGKADPIADVKCSSVGSSCGGTVGCGCSAGFGSSVAGGVGCSFSDGAETSGWCSDSSGVLDGSLTCGGVVPLLGCSDAGFV